MQQVVNEGELHTLSWQNFDVVVAIRSGDSEGVPVFVTPPGTPHVGWRHPRRRSAQSRRLLVRVDDPQDVAVHARIRKALGISEAA